MKMCFWVHSLYLVGLGRQISKVPFIGAQTPFMWAPSSRLIFPKCIPPNIVWLWGLSFSMWLLGDTNTNSVGRSLENLVTWWPANTIRGSTLVIWPFDCFWLLIEGGMFWQLWGILKLFKKKNCVSQLPWNISDSGPRMKEASRAQMSERLEGVAPRELSWWAGGKGWGAL